MGGVDQAEKVDKIVKTGATIADAVIGTSHALKDFHCGDPICGTIDVIGSVSSVLSLILGNIPPTEHLTFVTGSITVRCQTVRYYCKHYGTFWGCTSNNSTNVISVKKKLNL